MRCFIRFREEDEYFMEVSGYSKYEPGDDAVQRVNNFLQLHAPKAGKAPYGSKAKQLQEMYSSWVGAARVRA